MIINTKPITKIRINSLGDLANFKTFMDTNNLKINKSQIARELDVDPRTITKYLEGYEKPIPVGLFKIISLTPSFSMAINSDLIAFN